MMLTIEREPRLGSMSSFHAGLEMTMRMLKVGFAVVY